AVAHSSLAPPLGLEARADPVLPGRPALLVGFVHDAAGVGVSGVTVSMAGVDAVTGDDGRASIAVPVAEGDNSWPVRALAPNLTLDSYAPRRPPAQRVAKPSV